MIKANITRVSDFSSIGTKTFSSYKEMIKYMQGTYDTWVIEFLGNGDIDLEIYDDYRE